MRIESLNICHLRSIRDVTIRFDPLTALIGANNAGKSTILKAIELFFDPAPKLSQDDYSKGADKKPIEIAISFTDLTPEEISEFGGAVIDGKLVVARQFGPDESETGQYSVQARICPRFSEIRDEKNGTTKRTKYNALAAEIDGLERVTSVQEVESSLAKWESEHPSECEPTKVRGFFGAINVANGKLRKKTTVHLVPAVRDVSETATDSRRSPVISLLTEISRQTFENQKEFAGFVTRTEAEFASLTDPSGIPELAGISDLLTESLQQFYTDSRLKADWNQSQGISLNFPTPSLVIDNRGTTTDLTRVGHGLQRAALFSVVQFLAQQSSAEDGDSSKDFDVAASDIIILVEEPEIYQHPSKQLVIFDAFKRLVESFNKRTGIRVQIIYTTHSEKFVRMDNFEIARIVRRTLDKEEHKTTASGLTIAHCSKTIAEMFDPPRTPLPDDSFVAKLHIFSREVCEGFFASRIILVEGITDKAILEAAYTACNRNVHQEATAIISVEGKNKMDKPAFIFSRLGIPTYLVFDNDRAKGKKDANILLQKICGTEKIEDYPTGSFNRFSAIDSNLEAYFRSRLGSNYDAWLKEIATEFELEFEDIKKTPAAICKIFLRAKAEGITFELFDEIIAKVDSL